MCNSGMLKFLAVLAIALIAAAGANAGNVSMGTATAVDGDELSFGTYLSKPLINAFNSTTTGTLNAIEIVVDMGQVKTVSAIKMQNFPETSYGVPWDLRIYVAPNENAMGFDPMLASNFSQEITSGRTPFDFDSAAPDVIKTLTLSSNITARYIKIDVTGTGFGGINGSQNTLSQWEDIDATYVPEPASAAILLFGGLFASFKRKSRKV